MPQTQGRTYEHRGVIERISDTSLTIIEMRIRVPESFAFKAGQYVWIQLLNQPEKTIDRRAFSIISSDGDRGSFSIVLRKTGSAYNSALCALRLADEIVVLGPFGSSFCFPSDVSIPVVCFGGGVGISPFISLARSLAAEPRSGRKLSIIRVNDHPEDDIYRDEMSGYVSSIPSFSSVYIPHPPTKAEVRRIEIPENGLVYIAGSQPFVTYIATLLLQYGVGSSQMRFESNYPLQPASVEFSKLFQNGKLIGLTESVSVKDQRMFRLLNGILEESTNHIVITDVDGRILFANDAAERITGFTFEEMVGNTPRLWGGLMNPSFYQDLWRSKVTGETVHTKVRNRRKNGDEYFVQGHISAIKNDEGELIGWIGVEEDVSDIEREKQEAKRQSQALQQTKEALLNLLEDIADEKVKVEQQEARDTAVFQSIGDGFVTMDLEGRIVNVNRAFEELLGWSATEVEGRVFSTVVPMFDKNGVKIHAKQRPYSQALQNKTMIVSAPFETYFFQRKDQTRFAAYFTISPIILNEKTVGAVEVFRDMSHEEAVDRAKTEFVSLASHQLRTPLSAINWYAEMLMAGDAGALNTEQRGFVDEIYNGNKRMVELVNSLLNVSRIELGTFAVDPVDVKISEVIESVMSELQQQITEKEMAVTASVDSEIQTMQLDPSLFRIVIQNFLTNAIKYTPPKGSVHVAVKKQQRDVLFSIADTGYGIPEKDQSKIFNKLFRADNIKSKDTTGTGLGLYIVRSIIEQAAQGKVWFESKEQKGTTFYFTLPIDGMKKKDGSKALT
ncbi:PAS domain S-box protein [Patescibacteria group bacterium]|nr:PAS domain S-box protein [Patescibacteria group bacterium]